MTAPSSSRAAPFAIGALILCLAIAAGWAGWLARESGAEARDMSAMTLLDQPRPVPAFSLVNAQGEPVDETSLAGNWHLLFFGFTHCPAICPNTLALLDTVTAELSTAGKPTDVVLITVDPERDTPDRLQSYLAGFNPAFQGITGEPERLAALRKALFIPARRIETETGYTMDHGSAVVVTNPDAAVAGYFTPPLDAQAMARDLSRLIRS